MRKAVFILVFLLIALAYLTPMELGDIWWHLASGKWIAANSAFPTNDTFSATEAFSPNAAFTLKAFWLYQLFVYSLWTAFGLAGIIAIKALFIAGASVAAPMSAMRDDDANRAAAVMISVLPAALMMHYYDEARPQTFAYLLFALELLLIERSRPARLMLADGKPVTENAGGGRHVMLLPFLMLVWANCHPSYVIGLALAALYLAEHIVVATAFGRREAFNRSYAVSLALTLPISALNPNGLAAVSIMGGVAGGTALDAANPQIHEHLPMFAFAEMTRSAYLPVILIGIVTAAAAAIAIRWRRTDIVRTLIVITAGYLAFRTFRMGVFFAMLASVVIADAVRGISFSPRPALRKVLAVLAALVFIALAVTLLPRTIIRQPEVLPVVPVKSASYIAKSSARGAVFAPYEWGGYYIWRLGPERKVFIDGRGLSDFRQYDDVASAKEGYKDILDKRNVDTVAFWPLMPYKDSVPALVLRLAGDPAWRAVYWDSSALVFMRAEAAEHPLSEQTVWTLLISLIESNISLEPREARHYMALGELYMARGFTYDAEKAFGKARALKAQ